ncbi:hypothetical protein GCM10017687_77130 [Streptomyces echinatus]|uniref:hypothetical protein n=1 Tax=Streptomyces echinatus TaxID=67293 RepID=UPI0031EBD288
MARVRTVSFFRGDERVRHDGETGFADRGTRPRAVSDEWPRAEVASVGIRLGW